MQAFPATCFTWLMTAAGAAMVFFFKGFNRKLLDGMRGFAVKMTLDAALG